MPPILALVLRAMPGLSEPEVHAVVDAVTQTAPQTSVSVPLVVAIMTIESGGRARACANDAYGGSARGLMQIRVPHSRCGDGRRPDLFDPRHNVREGIRILLFLKQWERDFHHDQHNVLFHYAGGSHSYVKRVAALLHKLEGRDR